MISKKKVTEGVYFISIPEVNLHIQCAAPIESVKHLIHQGHIASTTKNGVTFQTGPNAILLSDVMIQNGEFCNMSEFSVLQMLYKQGLMIPNHPNNSGLKPILIGNKRQVNAQMNYIYRGNYGLISQEEIESCGLSSAEAKAIYNMKLRFAFGKLQPVSDLLESCFVEYEKIEIRDGVFIERMGVNIFEISYKTDSVRVDLNLKKDQTYVAPYILPYSKVNKEYFSIIHSGQGDGWDPLRPSLNSIICFQGKYYLIDVVPHIYSILESLSLSINDIEGVFLTHCHDDHIGGITTLVRSDKKIKIYSTKIVSYSLVKKLAALLNIDETEFENLLDIYDLELNKWNMLDELEIQPILSAHSVETTIFIFRTYFKNRYYSYGHFADIADSAVLKDMIVSDENSYGVSQIFYEKTLALYTQKLDIKKIDIGEGMIHGNYKDFISDPTKRIILGHTSEILSKEQLAVGIASSFGTQDILIVAQSNYDYATVHKQLQSNFPSLNRKSFGAFFEFEVVHFQPNELLYASNEKITFLYLILSGLVQKINSDETRSVLLEPGVIIGEKRALNDQTVESKFITKNYVKTLKIPLKYFHYFSKKYNLNQDFYNKFDRGRHVFNNRLFNENISYATLNFLLDNMRLLTVDLFNNEQFNKECVYLIIEGSVSVTLNGVFIETVTQGGYFGGIEFLFHTPFQVTYTPLEKCRLYMIEVSLIRTIPISFWKMLEDYNIFQKKVLDLLV